MVLKSFPKSNKIYLISDIHGGLKPLQELVSNIEENSYLFILGDIFEKGIDSLKTLEYIIELSKKDNVFVIMGNNDYALLKILDPFNIESFKKRINRKTSIIYQIIDRYNLVGSEEYLQKRINEIFKVELDWINCLDTYIEIEDFVLVHAGVDAKSIKESSFKALVGLDNFYNIGHSLSKIVICGHYPVSMYRLDRYDNSVLIDLDKKIICIDGGYGATNIGQINMLEITKSNNGYSYKTYSRDYYLEALVVKPQVGKRISRGVCWPHYQLELIKKGKYFSKVRINTNEIVKIKNELMEIKNDIVYALDDSPNNLLDVRENDIIKVMNNKTKGYLLGSINGECGWISYSKVKYIRGERND